MIIDAFFEVLLSPLVLLLNGLPVLDVNIPSGILSTFGGIVSTCFYFLPMGAILSCLALIFALRSFKLVLALVVRVKSFIPTMGS